MTPTRRGLTYALGYEDGMREAFRAIAREPSRACADARVEWRSRSLSYIPLSVREGNCRKRFAWHVKGRREALALRLAPWLGGNR